MADSPEIAQEIISGCQPGNFRPFRLGSSSEIRRMPRRKRGVNSISRGGLEILSKTRPAARLTIPRGLSLHPFHDGVQLGIDDFTLALRVIGIRWDHWPFLPLGQKF